MDWFAQAYTASSDSRIVYHESYDGAGNAEGPARTIVVAVNGAPLIGDTRRFAEARVRFAAGITLLAPGTPMSFMGAEVGALLPSRHDHFQIMGWETQENLFELRLGVGAHLFRFYSDVIRVRLAHPALTSRNCEVVHIHNDSRTVAFRRWAPGEEMLVIGCLRNRGVRGYLFQSPLADGRWREVFNSDAPEYGGGVMLNTRQITSADGTVRVDIPPSSVLILQRQ